MTHFGSNIPLAWHHPVCFMRDDDHSGQYVYWTVEQVHDALDNRFAREEHVRTMAGEELPAGATSWEAILWDDDNERDQDDRQYLAAMRRIVNVRRACWGQWSIGDRDRRNSDWVAYGLPAI
jgi:hypothetical protein